MEFDFRVLAVHQMNLPVVFEAHSVCRVVKTENTVVLTSVMELWSRSLEMVKRSFLRDASMSTM